MPRLPGWAWLLLAIGFATLATFMAMGYIKGQTVKAPIKEEIYVVRANTKVEQEKILSAAQLKRVKWNQEKPPQDFFSEVKDVAGRESTKSLAPDDIITRENTQTESLSGLAGKIGSDERAMTVKVDEASGVAGFLKPGDRVDVMVFMDKGVFDLDPFAQILLQNRKVLAIGQKKDNLPGDKTQITSTVTLAVTPQEGEGLTWASQRGRISLVLRNPHDKIADKNKEKEKTPGANAKGLFGWLSLKSKPAPPTVTVEMIRGLDRAPVTIK